MLELKNKNTKKYTSECGVAYGFEFKRATIAKL